MNNAWMGTAESSGVNALQLPCTPEDSVRFRGPSLGIKAECHLSTEHAQVLKKASEWLDDMRALRKEWYPGKHHLNAYVRVLEDHLCILWKVSNTSQWREGRPGKKSGLQASEPAPPVTYFLQIWPASKKFHSCHLALPHDASHTRSWRTFSFWTITQGCWEPHCRLLDCHLSRKMWHRVSRVWRMLATTLTYMEMCECLTVSRNGDAARTKGIVSFFFLILLVAALF